MSFTTGATMLDAIVLSVVEREETGNYGYKITREIKQVLDLSESTLYPVLRRLQREGSLTAHDEPFNGRNRRYYRVTEKGRAQLTLYRIDWQEYTEKINQLLLGGTTHDA